MHVRELAGQDGDGEVTEVGPAIGRLGILRRQYGRVAGQEPTQCRDLRARWIEQRQMGELLRGSGDGAEEAARVSRVAPAANARVAGTERLVELEAQGADVGREGEQASCGDPVRRLGADLAAKVEALEPTETRAGGRLSDELDAACVRPLDRESAAVRRDGRVHLLV